MQRLHTLTIGLTVLLLNAGAAAQSPATVEIPTRPGVTQRILVLKPENPKAAVILFAGGDGGIGIELDGRIRRSGNFLVRSRRIFAEQGLLTAVIDAPSDLQSHPFLSGHRQTAEHVADVKAVIAWLREQAQVPVWLVGTSRGTQSAAWVATQLAREAGGPDGLVLTSTMLDDHVSRPVPAMPLDRLRIPVLVVHHRDDACRHCRLADMPKLMDRLTTPPRRELLVFEGGVNTGDVCGAFAWHGFNGIEREVVSAISAWITAR